MINIYKLKAKLLNSKNEQEQIKLLCTTHLSALLEVNDLIYWCKQ